MMTKRSANKTRAAEGGGKLRALFEAIRRRFRGHRAELEGDAHSESDASRERDAVGEAGVESFPASDPPSFTPEKST